MRSARTSPSRTPRRSPSSASPAARILSAIIAASLLATLGAITMTGVRVLEAMGSDHHALRFLARDEAPVSRTALLLQNGLAFVLAATGRIEGLLLYMGMTLTLVSGLTLLGVFALRWREPDRPRPYRVPLYPLTPLVALAITAWVVIDTVRAEPIAGWTGALTVLAGVLAYAVLSGSSPRVGGRRRP